MILSIRWASRIVSQGGLRVKLLQGIARVLEGSGRNKLGEGNLGYGLPSWDSGSSFVPSGEAAWGQRTLVDKPDRLAICGSGECV